MKYFYILFAVLLFSSCSKNDVVEQNLNFSEIEIYLVEGEGTGFFESTVELNSLPLEDEPWLKHSEILFYDWSAHMFFLNAEKEKEKYAQRNFVVVSDGNPLFVGVFFPAYMSSIPQIPSIWAADNLFVPQDVVSFGQYGYFYSGNIGEENEFRQALINSGLYREGIQVELIEVNRLNSRELEYTFTVENKDVGNIYVLDPVKMGNKRYHYFTNGVSVRKNETSYFPVLDNTPSDEILDSWYQKLRPGESMTRTIKLAGYVNLPKGKVICNFIFPGSRVQKGEWNKTDGRVWLGNYYMESEFVLD